MARDRGCQHVVVTRDHRVADAVQRQCGGADVIVDGLGDGLGDSLDDGPGDAAREQNFAALAPCGHWISLGPAAGGLESIDSSPLVQKSAFFLWPVIFACLSSPAPLLWRTQRLWAALADGSIRKPAIERYTLDAAAQAHVQLESRQSVGPLVLMALAPREARPRGARP